MLQAKKGKGAAAAIALSAIGACGLMACGENSPPQPKTTMPSVSVIPQQQLPTAATWRSVVIPN